MLRIIIVNKPGHPIPYVGGVERYSFELAKHLAKREIETLLISSFLWKFHSKRINKLILVNAPLPLYRIAKEGKFTWFLHHLIGSISYSIRTIRYILQLKVDVIHTNDGFTTFILHLLRFLLRRRFTLVTTIHAPPPWEMSYGKHITLIKIVYILLYVLGMLVADKVIGVNPVICKSLKKKKNKYVFVPNALPDDYLRNDIKYINANGILKRYNIEKDYYLFVGRLVPEKGIDTLIKVFLKYKYKFNGKNAIVVVGKGPLEKYVRKASRLISDFYYLGYVPKEHLKALYKKARALLITSRTEGLPTVILEALACGTTVLALPIKGIQEFLSALNMEQIIITKSSNELIKTLKELETGNTSRTHKLMGMVELTWDRTITKIINTYLELLCKRQHINTPLATKQTFRRIYEHTG